MPHSNSRGPSRRSLALTMATLAAAAVFAAEVPQAIAVGKPAPDFTLPGSDGSTHALSDLRSSKGVVIIFVSTRCPVSNAYNERMARLADTYSSKGIRFVGINANKAEQPEEIADHARKHQWSFPVLKDAGNKVADLYGATVTPEAFVVDPSGVVRYHGRIDDSQDAPAVKARDLDEALDALLAGREVAKKEAKAFGCSIKRG
ncbi:MAG: thioredoxin family protein [Candidatus Polarisedimenticolia bacterium]